MPMATTTSPYLIELGSTQFWRALHNDPRELAAMVCAIDLVDLEATLYKHPGLRAWANAAHEVARVAEERAKWRVTTLRARKMLEAKTTPDGKSKTVSLLAAEVDTDPEVQAAETAWYDSMDERGALRAIASALEDRLQMLIQIAAKRRQETRES